MVRFNNRGLANILILVGLGAAVIVLAVLVVGILKNKMPVQPVNLPGASTYSPSPTSQELKTFQSESMKFSIELSSNYQVDEKLGSVIVTTKDGEIYIDRNG